MLTRSCVYYDPAKFAFSGLQMQEMRSQTLGTLKPLVLRLSRNLIQKSPKCRQKAHTTFTLGRNSIFRPPKCIKWATRKYVPLNRRFHDSQEWGRGCHVPMNRGFYDPPNIAPCVSWLRRNRIFMTPKCRKWIHTKVCSLEPWVSRFGKIAFSGLKNEENLLKLRDVPLNRRQKSHFHAPRIQKMSLHRLFNESTEIAFSGRQSAENELTHS